MIKTMNRRDFVRFRRATPRAATPAQTTRYEVREQRTLAPPPTAGLEPYTGAWDYSAVHHLLKRTMFGATLEDINYFQTLGFNAAISEILSTPDAPPQIVNDYADDDPDVPFGEDWTTAPYNNEFEYYRTMSLRVWWKGLIHNQTRSVFEKMVFFWHNHIPIEFDATFHGVFCHRYLMTIREHSMGNFRDLTKAMTLDPAMLFYLNGQYNEKDAPDENYGRELQELFCIGKGPDSQYTEEDVQAAARVLTGWKTDYDFPNTYFAGYAHDGTDKQFSAFYNNAVITGIEGDDGFAELDAMLDMMFANDEVALFICRKLYRFFVFQQIDQNAEENVIKPLAQIFRDNNYDITIVIKTLLSSAHFFEEGNRGAVIKSPVDFMLGMAREMKMEFPIEPYDLFQVRSEMTYWMSDMLMTIGDPPNVAGWPAWYQQPTYDRSWLTTSTYPKRARNIDHMIYWGYASDNYLIGFDLVKYVSQFSDPADPVLLIDEVTQHLFGLNVSPTVKLYLKEILLTGQSNDGYWYTAWTQYTNNPDDEMALETVTSRLKSMFRHLINLEEYQLM